MADKKQEEAQEQQEQQPVDMLAVFKLIESFNAESAKFDQMSEELDKQEEAVETAREAMEAHPAYKQVADAIRNIEGKKDTSTPRGARAVEGYPYVLIDSSSGKVVKDINGKPYRKKRMNKRWDEVIPADSKLVSMVGEEAAKKSAWYNRLTQKVVWDYSTEDGKAKDSYPEVELPEGIDED